MNKKEKCKEIMLKIFGPASAKLVDGMDEEMVVNTCYAKVSGFFGIVKADELFKGLK